MKISTQSRVAYVLCSVMLLTLTGAVLTVRRIERIRASVRPQEILYIPSAKVLRRMSLGYTGLLADIYWTRAVQYFGGKHRDRSTDYHLLYPLLDITTQLDPHLIVAYRFGATFLGPRPPNGAGVPEKAVELIERGIKENPDEWRLYYELGFLQAMELHDYVAAAKTFQRGAQVPKAHPFLKVLAATMAQHGGDLQTARLMWQTTLETTDDVMIRQNAEHHLRALEVDEIVPKLEELVRQFRDRTGAEPPSFAPLVSGGWLRRFPVDPLGLPYKLRPDGRVEVQDPDALPFIHQGLPPGYEPKVPRNGVM
jgi:hypothetical protein